MHSLKAVFLHKDNVLPSILVAYATHKQEANENTKAILSFMNDKTYQWRICGDLKVIVILIELQKGYTKLYYFLCERDSHAKIVHCRKKN
jgi:hypothetical protein